MNLGEITEDYSVSVNVIKGDAGATFSSKPAFIVNGDLYVQPFRYDNHIINFSADGISFEFSAVREGEVPYFWKNVSVTKKTHEGEVYHVIHAEMDGVRLNRRNSFRVFIGLEGTAVRLSNKSSENVTIKDISSTGVAIITRNKEEALFKVGEQLQVYYRDEDFYMDIDVNCRVVRIFTTDVGYVYGCQFSRMYPRVENYVATRQLKKAKKS